jgi:L-fuconolactonase
MIIDSHQHFWNYDPVRYDWIDESMRVLQRDFLPKDLAPILNENGVDGCVAVQAEQSLQETVALLAHAQSHNFIKGVVGWVDLRCDGIKADLERFADDGNLKGIRHIVQGQVAGFMLDPKFNNGIGLLKDFGLTYDVLIYRNQLEEAAAFVAKHPDQPFVLDHLAKPYINGGLEDSWVQSLSKLAQFPNVQCKLSGLVTETKDFVCLDESSFHPFMEVALECFGPERLMFGSDWPVCTLSAPYGQVLSLVKSYVSKLSENEQDAILGGNAHAFYDL